MHDMLGTIGWTKVSGILGVINLLLIIDINNYTFYNSYLFHYYLCVNECMYVTCV